MAARGPLGFNGTSGRARLTREHGIFLGRREERMVANSWVVVVVIAVLAAAWGMERWVTVGEIKPDLVCKGCRRRELTIRGLQILLFVASVVLVMLLAWGCTEALQLQG